MTIILTIVFAALFLLCAVIFYIFFLRKGDLLGIHDDGQMLFKLDLENRKIFYYRNQLNSAQNGHLFKEAHKYRWSSIDKLAHRFQNTDGESLFNFALHKLKSGEHETYFSFWTNEFWKRKPGNISYLFKVSIAKLEKVSEEKSFYTMVFKWQKKDVALEGDHKYDLISKRSIVSNKLQFKAFIAFNLLAPLSEKKGEFLAIFLKIVKLKQSLSYFFINGSIVFVLFDKNNNLLYRKVNRIIKLVNKHRVKSGLNQLFDGTGYFVGQNIDSNKRFNDLEKLLQYFLSVSIKNKKQFIWRESTLFDETQYQSFVESSKVMSSVLREDNIQTELIPVFNIKNKRKIIDYAKPRVYKIAPPMEKLIMSNQHNKNILMNHHAGMVAAKKEGKPFLVDIDLKWVAKNEDMINFKRAIYILNFGNLSLKADTQKLIHDLKAKGFIFAIRVKVLSFDLLTLIEKLKPQFIVVDAALNGTNINEESYATVLVIQKVAKEKNIKVIFEKNESKHKDNTSVSTNINYSYGH